VPAANITPGRRGRPRLLAALLLSALRLAARPLGERRARGYHGYGEDAAGNHQGRVSRAHRRSLQVQVGVLGASTGRYRPVRPIPIAQKDD